jgi:shikimate kinase
MQSSHNSPFRGLGGNIFLIGFMGSGKTYWGKQWAAEYNLSFHDLDTMIESETGKTVAEIFEEDGEEFFREKEKQLIRTFKFKDNCIVSCGGGTPCFNDNMQWMNEHGTTVYLAATPQYIYERIAEETDKRPL